MAAMKNTFRASMAWLHTTLGLFTGWILLAIVLSGTLSVFRPEITLWCHPELGSTPTNPLQASSHAIAWLNQHAPGSDAWFLETATDRAPFTTATWPDPHGNYQQRILDPATGSPDGLRDTPGGEFFYRFHFELQLPYPWGRMIAAIAALALVTALLTGIIVHKRILLDFFTFRPGTGEKSWGQRSWMDVHTLLGVAALPFHLMIAFTGAVTLGSLLLPWPTQAIYRHDLPSADTDLNPALHSRPATGHPAHLTPILPLLQDATRRFNGTGIAQIYVFNPGDQGSLITILSGNTGTISTTRQILTFDGPTGRLIASHTENRPVIRLYTFLYGLHIARFAPVLTRWLYFLSGLALATVIGSGMHLWAIKRLRHHPHHGHRLTNRLNIGMLAGTPLAFAAFFLANLLLPTPLPSRASRTVEAVFTLWAAALLYALFRRPERAWPELLGSNAIACLSIALLSMPWHTTPAIGTGLTALGLANLFGYATLHTASKRTRQT